MLKAKILKFSLLAIIAIALIVISCLSSTLFAAETSDFKQVNYTQLLTNMGTGWNLGNSMEAAISGTPFETNWGNPVVTKEFITKVKAAGFNNIRIPVSYLSRIGNAPDYTIESTWLDRVQEIIDYAYSQDMYVIINMHGDGYHTVEGGWLLPDVNDQAAIREKFAKVWEQIAERFINYDERLIFEAMNEVFDGDWDAPEPLHYENFNTFNQIFVDTVRKTGGNNAARWLLVPGWNTNIDYTTGDFGFKIPTDNYRASSIPDNEKRLAISVHYYSPWDFCGDTSSPITQWGQEAKNPDKVSTWGQEDYMESQFNAMYKTFVTKGYPFIIGEYGTIDKTSLDTENKYFREYFTEKVCSTIKKYGGVPVYWDNGYNGNGGHAVFDRSTGNITQQGIVNSIMAALKNTADFDPDITPVPLPATPLPEGSFTVDYDATGGSTINVSIQNNLTTRHINGWTMEFTFPGDQKITNLWNGTFTQNGQTVTIKNADYNGQISANGGKVSFGFSVSTSGNNEKPATCTVNGVKCIIVPGASTTSSSPIITPVTTTSPTPTATTSTTKPDTSTPIITTTATPATQSPTTSTILPPSSNTGYILSYTLLNDWGGGATVGITLKNNTKTAINGWTLSWTFSSNQVISNLWNGAYVKDATLTKVTNESYNKVINANGGTVSFGFNMTYSGTNTIPSDFSLNGVDCVIQ